MDTDGRVYVEGGLVIDVADAKELGQCFSEVRDRARRAEGWGVGSEGVCLGINRQSHSIVVPYRLSRRG